VRATSPEGAILEPAHGHGRGAQAAHRILRASGLSLSRGRRQLLNQISFALEPGQWIALTGANGSGKSSLLRALAGLLSWDGEPHLSLGEQRLERLSHPPWLRLVFQGHAPGWNDALSVRENLRWQCALDAGKQGTAPTREAIEKAMNECGIRPQGDLPFRLLSAGQKRRVSVARLRISLWDDPPAGGVLLWLLDEPSTALDDEGQKLLGASLGELCKGSGMAIVATHGPIPGAPAAVPLHLGPSSLTRPHAAGGKTGDRDRGEPQDSKC